MPLARLLHRERSARSLKAIVDTAQKDKTATSTADEFHVEVRNTLLVLDCIKSSRAPQKATAPNADEGFESDIDSISLVSNDDTFTTSKGQESDSANGSACSDSDSDTSSATVAAPPPPTQSSAARKEETFNLVNCVCYTDIKYPDLLVFVVFDETLVFRFDRIDELQLFYAHFSAIKAVSNQKTYGKSNIQKFNLLQRTDANGVTHIEISRPNYEPPREDDYEPSSIISITPPENFTKSNLKKSLSSENLLDSPSENLKKNWNSAENLLDAPKRPERRRKPKGPAPQPPTQQNILHGQYVRVNVLKAPPPPPPVTEQPNKFSFLRPRKFPEHQWTSSMPRLLKPKPKPDIRLYHQPMAYRYIDTTAPPTYIPRFKPNPNKNFNISNRLFGMSSKLKEFASVQSSCDVNSKYQDPRYSSLGNLSYKSSDNALKSVIKKDDVKRKNDKKVTFSAYNTVQVV